MFNIRDTDIVIKYDPLLSNNLIAVTLLLTLLSLFDWKTERAIQNRFPVSSFLPLKKKARRATGMLASSQFISS